MEMNVGVEILLEPMEKHGNQIAAIIAVEIQMRYAVPLGEILCGHLV
jgi:hypothetical protein